MGAFDRSDLIVAALLRAVPDASVVVVARGVPGWVRFHTGPLTYVGHAPKPDALPVQATAHVATSPDQVQAALAVAAASQTRSADLIFLQHGRLLRELLDELAGAGPLSHPRTLVLVDGAVPPERKMAGPRPEGGWWVGDVWMVAHMLRPARSWALIETCAVWPTGLLAVSGAEPLEMAEMAAVQVRLAALDDAGFAAARPHLPPERFAAACVAALSAIGGPVTPARLLAAGALVTVTPGPAGHPAVRHTPLSQGAWLETVSDALVLGTGAVLRGGEAWGRGDLDVLADGYGSVLNLGTGLRRHEGAVVIERARLDQAADGAAGPVMLGAADDPRAWAAWLHQVVPAAWAYVRAAPAGTRLLADIDQPWQRRMLEVLGVDLADVLPLDRSRPLRVPEVTILRDAAGYARDVFATLAARLGHGRSGGRISVGAACIPALQAACAATGLLPARPAELAPHERIALFATASVAVVVGADALADVVFCGPDARVIGIVPEARHAAIRARHVGDPAALRLIDDGSADGAPTDAAGWGGRIRTSA